MEIQPALYMIPVAISDGAFDRYFPAYNSVVIQNISCFIVENVRTARRFLKKLSPSLDISTIRFYELNGHTPEHEISTMLDPLREGEATGVMSEAGCPGIADPGASVVRVAQAEGLKVVPLIGPSSILLALMASGLNGQKFSFQGYLPVKDSEREKSIRDLEHESRRNDTTQIFIETPYRNQKMMQSLLRSLNAETLLCVASDVSNPETESIVTKTVKEWKAEGKTLDKVPTIFLFYCPDSPRRRGK